MINPLFFTKFIAIPKFDWKQTKNSNLDPLYGQNKNYCLHYVQLHLNKNRNQIHVILLVRDIILKSSAMDVFARVSTETSFDPFALALCELLLSRGRRRDWGTSILHSSLVHSTE